MLHYLFQNYSKQKVQIFQKQYIVVHMAKTEQQKDEHQNDKNGKVSLHIRE